MSFDQAKRAFLRIYDRHLVAETREQRVSDLSPREQADFRRRQVDLHPSSFPVCPLRMAFERYLQDDDPVVYQNFASDYYLSVGTIAHTLLQRWLGRSGYIIGNWTCAKCKTAYRFCTVPSKCRSCKHTTFNYHELGGKDDNVRWHMDTLFKFRDQLWVVDYKTTSEFMLTKHRGKQGPVFPYYGNLFQVEAYVPLVERKYNVKIAGIMLPYVSRSTPNNSTYGVEVVGEELTESKRERLHERLERFKKAHALSLKVLKAPRKVFKLAIETKLCEDEDFYEEKVRGYNPCPLAEGGMCWKRSRLLKYLKEKVDEYEGESA